MKTKSSLQSIRIFVLAIISAFALWQISIRTHAQKVEKPETSLPASTNSLNKTTAGGASTSSPNNAEYAAKVKANTTESYFMTELVDHLPASDKVPSPDKILGYTIGEPGHLTYTKDMYRWIKLMTFAAG